MIKNFNVPILKLDGTEFDDKLTLQTVTLLSLITPIRSDESKDTNYKLSLYRLAQKINSSHEVDITAEDIVLIKDRISTVMQNIVVIGRAFDMLEGRMADK